ncbi:MAG: hypothetical protein MR521_09275 [Butyricicoccus sp.]|nr:hypothetical protein [Butyricicoccus sp.]
MTTSIYPFLKSYFYASVVSTLLAIIPTNAGPLNVVSTLVSLACSVVCLYELYQMRNISDHLNRAFLYQIGGLIGALVSLLVGLIVALANPRNVGFMMFTMVIALVFAVIALMGSYHFYWGLDELIELNGYHYPLGRIKWCFYLTIIGGVVSWLCSLLGIGLLNMLITAGFSAAQLYLLWQYIQAVRAREEDQPLL